MCLYREDSQSGKTRPQKRLKHPKVLKCCYRQKRFQFYVFGFELGSANNTTKGNSRAHSSVKGVAIVLSRGHNVRCTS